MPLPPSYRFEHLTEAHDRTFRSGNAAIDYWLEKHSLRWEQLGYSRTYVLVDSQDGSLAGFFALKAESQYLVGVESAPPIEGELVPPVVEIAYLARHIKLRGQEIGAVLLFEALKQCQMAAETIGVIAVYLNPTKDGRRLYAENGFKSMEGDSSRMFLMMSEVRAMLAEYPESEPD